jgi:hypothetical protein
MTFDDWFYSVHDGFVSIADGVKEDMDYDFDKFLVVQESMQDAYEAGQKSREWVGLTDHELQVLDFNDPERGKLARAVEAKLKERNA